MNTLSLAVALAFSGFAAAKAADHVLHSFKKTQLSDKFWCEGASFGDFNHDGKPDIVSGPYWWEGPGYQKRHEYYPASKTFKLKKADGTEETIEGFEGALGANNTYSDNFFAFTYDFNKDGWWEQPKSLTGDPVWKFHKFAFNPDSHGGAQMYAYDVNGDGLNDVITSFAAHGYGLVWYEQLKQDGEISFKQHVILNTEQKPSPNKYGVTFSQLHAVDLVDMDGDGLKDIVTGKRFWAHGAHGDPDPNAPAVLYWFRLVRSKDKTVDFVPHLIDSDSGVGTQVVARDFTGDKKPDIVVGNKKGTFVFIQETRKVTKAEWEKAQPKPSNTAAVPPSQ